MNRSWKPLVLTLVFFAVQAIANSLAIIVANLLNSLTRSPADNEWVRKTLEGADPWFMLLTFLAPVIISVIYMRPLLQIHSQDPARRAEQIRNRVLNAPLMLSLIGISGWVVAILFFFYGAYYNDVPLRPSPTTRTHVPPRSGLREARGRLAMSILIAASGSRVPSARR